MFEQTDTQLAGQRVLVTRPQQQAHNMCRLISAHGGIAECFPTLETRPVSEQSGLNRQIAQLSAYDWLIFVSANAVNFAVREIGGKIDRLKQAKIAAVGQATAKALAASALTVDLVPDQGYNSEALLAENELNNVSGLRCLIVRGQGGREYLAETLRARGAEVDYMEVYCRVMPDSDTIPVIRLLQRHELSALTITSGESLKNLMAMLADQKELLFQLPLVVISERIQIMAETMGFQQIAVSESPADQAVVRTLIMLLRGKQWPK